MATTDKDYAEKVANAIIEQLKEGTAPWQKPWSGGQKFAPHNPVSGVTYKGGNALYLMARQQESGYSDSRWLTYQQAKELGGQVRKGEKGTECRFWQWSQQRTVKDEQGRPVLDAEGNEVKETVRRDRPLVRSFVVFNASQIDGLPPAPDRPQAPEWEVNERAEAILKNSGAKIEHHFKDAAFYRPGEDKIYLPEKGQFQDQAGYYGVALHELNHWTGHPDRLNRDLAHPFGSGGYAKEELRAEIASLMLSDELGVSHDPDQHVAYVESWIKALQDDPTEILRASADAQRITNFVLAFDPLRQQQEQTQTATMTPNRPAQKAEEKAMPKVEIPQTIDGQVVELGSRLGVDQLLKTGAAIYARDMAGIVDKQQPQQVDGLDGREISDLLADGQKLDWDTHYSDDPQARQHGADRIKAVKDALTAYSQQGEQQTGVASEIWRRVVKDNTRPDWYVEPTEEAIKTVDAASSIATSSELFISERKAAERGERLAHDYGKEGGDFLSAIWEEVTRGQEPKPETPAWFIPAEERDHPLARKVTQDTPMSSALMDELAAELVASTPGQVATQDTPLVTEFSDRAKVKELGAKWNRDDKVWFVPAGTDLAPFAKWLQPAEEAQEQTQPLISETDTQLNTKFSDRAEVKELGAKWDKDAKKWTVPAGTDLRPFSKWLEQDAQTQPAAQKAQSSYVGRPVEVPEDQAARQVATQDTPLNVHISERHDAKELGARWNRDNKFWYVPKGKDLAPFAKWLGGKTASQTTEADRAANAVDELADVLKQAGFKLKGPPKLDGVLHRVPVEGDKGHEKSGAYKAYSDGRPAGWYQNHKTGERQNWKSQQVTHMTPEEREAQRAAAAQAREARERETAAKMDRTAAVAGDLLASAAQASPDHPYLMKKQVQPFGLKQATAATVAIADEAYGKGEHTISEGDLLIPMQQKGDEIRSVQVVKNGGWKGFLKDGQVNGTYALLGELGPDTKAAWVAEGYATGASVHQATGQPVAVAFNASNLTNVAKEIREQMPDGELYIAADNDRHLEHKNPPRPNVGREKGEEAARASDGIMVLPTLGPDTDGVDWNDVAVHEGLPGLGRQLQDTLNNAQKIEANRDKDQRQHPDTLDEVTAKRDTDRQELVEAFRDLRGSAGIVADKAKTQAAALKQSETASVPTPKQSQKLSRRVGR